MLQSCKFAVYLRYVVVVVVVVVVGNTLTPESHRHFPTHDAFRRVVSVSE